MTYLLNVQKAIAQTDVIEAPSIEYAEGWVECGQVLTYGISCGSEHAVKSQIRYWLNPTGCKVLDAATVIDENDESDKGYLERMKAIQLILERM